MILPSFENTDSQKVRCAAIYDRMEKQVEDKYDEALRRRFVDNSSQLGSMFLHTYPSDGYSTFSDAEYSSAIAYRLLTTLGTCRQCTNVVADGHESVCERSHSLRIRRHELCKGIFARILQNSGVDVQLEPHASNNAARRAGDLVKTPQEQTSKP